MWLVYVLVFMTLEVDLFYKLRNLQTHLAKFCSPFKKQDKIHLELTMMGKYICAKLCTQGVFSRDFQPTVS